MDSYFPGLVDDVIDLIISYCDPITLSQLRQVNKMFYNLIPDLYCKDIINRYANYLISYKKYPLYFKELKLNKLQQRYFFISLCLLDYDNCECPNFNVDYKLIMSYVKGGKTLSYINKDVIVLTINEFNMTMEIDVYLLYPIIDKYEQDAIIRMYGAIRHVLRKYLPPKNKYKPRKYDDGSEYGEIDMILMDMFNNESYRAMYYALNFLKR